MQFHFLQSVLSRERSAAFRSPQNFSRSEVSRSAKATPCACTPLDRRTATVITTLPTDQTAGAPQTRVSSPLSRLDYNPLTRSRPSHRWNKKQIPTIPISPNTSRSERVTSLRYVNRSRFVFQLRHGNPVLRSGAQSAFFQISSR